MGSVKAKSPAGSVVLSQVLSAAAGLPSTGADPGDPHGPELAGELHPSAHSWPGSLLEAALTLLQSFFKGQSLKRSVLLRVPAIRFVVATARQEPLSTVLWLSKDPKQLVS